MAAPPEKTIKTLAGKWNMVRFYPSRFQTLDAPVLSVTL